MVRKFERGLGPLLGRGAGSPSSTMWPGPRLTSVPSVVLIHPAVWPQQIWAENWGLCPFWGARAGSPSKTMWPGSMPTCKPSFILIHPTVWPQYTKVRLAWCHEHSAATVTELLQPQDPSCGTLFQFKYAIRTSPTDCSYDSWRHTFFRKHEHYGAVWLWYAAP